MRVCALVVLGKLVFVSACIHMYVRVDCVFVYFVVYIMRVSSLHGACVRVRVY